MRRPDWLKWAKASIVGQTIRPAALRDRFANLLAAGTAACLGAVFVISEGTRFLMPGPLTSAHGAIKACNTCHTASGGGKVSWVKGLAAGQPHGDSKACISCHKMPETAFNAHGASDEILRQSTARLTKSAAFGAHVPQSARAQSIAFPADKLTDGGLTCAACHQEHQGGAFKLNAMSAEQCRSCHAVKFNSFDGDHPKFENYPFKRRTRIAYDHAGHFNKHYPELAKKEPAKRIPATCSTCHTSSDDRRVMAVAPFEKTCATCHLDQIKGIGRASGPKGIAFLSLPGLDLQLLKKKNAAIGEWPAASEAALSPFMKVMISRNEQGRALLKAVDGLNLQDLATANDDQIKSVTSLAWEIKGLIHKLISGKVSDVLGDLNLGGAKLSAGLVADLTASIPRDVVISAQQQWLPNLAAEIANGPNAIAQLPDSQPTNALTEKNSSPASSNSTVAEPGPAAERSGEDAKPDQTDPGAPAEDERKAPASTRKLDPPACLVRILGQCLMSKGQQGQAVGALSNDADGKTENGKASAVNPNGLPEKMNAGLHFAENAAPDATAGSESDTATGKTADGDKQSATNDAGPRNATKKMDELLFPTAEELQEINARNKATGRALQSEAAPSSSSAADGLVGQRAQSPPSASPVIGIDSGVDPESWAEYGGWYRQDYEILYRAAGHKDKFIYSWLFLTGPQVEKVDQSPASAVFAFLTSKDAQGSCTKCHSIDDLDRSGRAVNFSQASVATKQGSFTRFIHEPHFGVMENRGCLTCHSLESANLYLKSYEQGNPQSFASNFGDVKKDLCQTCHTTGAARQDCMTCHKYHVNGVVTPIMGTKNPTQ